MTILSLEHSLEIYAYVIQHTGGGPGLRDLGRLESAIATQTQNVFGEELYPSLSDKAAALIRSIIADHPFVDGNKRTAMLSGLTFLGINDISFDFIPGEIEDYAVMIASHSLNVTGISSWLNRHLT